MLASPSKPPLKALFVSSDTAPDVASALLRSRVVLDLHVISRAELRRDALRLRADVVLVDGSLVDALKLVRELRATLATLPILFLAPDIDDVIEAMAAGASDFALRRAGPAEIMLRLELLSSSAARPSRSVRHIGPLHLDRESRTLVHGSRSVSLSPIEMKVFEQLLLQPGRPVSRSELERSIWGQDELENHPTNIAVVYVSYLRRKLARLGHVCSITTITHVGYALVIRDATARLRRSVKRGSAH